MLDNINDILTPEDLLQILPIGRNTLYRLLKSGELKSKRLGGKYIVMKADLLQCLGITNTGGTNNAC